MYRRDLGICWAVMRAGLAESARCTQLKGLQRTKRSGYLPNAITSVGGDLCTTATCWQLCTVVLGHAQGQHLDSMMCFLAFLGVWQLGVVDGWQQIIGVAVLWTCLGGPQSQAVAVETDLYLFAVGVRPTEMQDKWVKAASWLV